MTFADLIYKIGAHIWNNKQTYTGYTVAAMSFIQANDSLRNLLPVSVYEWVMTGIGIAMVLFARSAAGGIVSKVLPSSVPAQKPPPTTPPPPAESGRASVWLLVAVATAGALGCAGAMIAHRNADTLSDSAYVLTEHYAALIHEAADLKSNPATPKEVNDKLRSAANASARFVIGDANANPPVPGLRELAQAYDAAKSAETEAELQRALDDAIVKVATFIRALRAAQARSVTGAVTPDRDVELPLAAAGGG